MMHEKREYISTNPYKKDLLSIFNLARIEYGPMDYSIKNGKIQV